MPQFLTFQDNSALNALTFDAAGNGYVSDARNGRIYKVTPNLDSATIWSSGGATGDPLLFPATPPGGIEPPFGVNGIEFNPPGCTPGPNCTLVAANTANRTILQITCCNASGNANPAAVFLNGINGPDGVAIDTATGYIWVASGQSDEIVVIQPLGIAGRAIAKLGDFNGIDGQGRAVEFLFPSSLAFSNLPANGGPAQRMLYVANLSSPNAGSIDTLWTLQVTQYTVAQLPVPAIPVTGCFRGSC